MSGFQTLFYKEVLRFWKVAFQTVAAPIVAPRRATRGVLAAPRTAPKA